MLLSMQHEAINSFILADSTYPSTSQIVLTFKTIERNRCPNIKSLNHKLTSIRYYIENTFGIAKLGAFAKLGSDYYPLECIRDDVI